MRKLPIDCKIIKIHPGKRPSTETILYAMLVAPDNSVIISSTLDYIINQLNDSELIPLEEYNELPFIAI